MKTTFSYFPGMSENLAPAYYYIKKIKNMTKVTVYECVEK